MELTLIVDYVTFVYGHVTAFVVRVVNLKHVKSVFIANSMWWWSFLHPQATDRDFVDKLNSKFKAAPNFELVRNHTPLFTIVHYAGKVSKSIVTTVTLQFTWSVLVNN